MTNNKKNSSAAKKLIPAAGALALSAMMLGSSTYAWFTMSREVEVKNISMTATTPEDVQISLGAIASAGASANLVANTGVLSTDQNGAAQTPASDYDWSNSADVSAYYALGKIMPASSVDGANIYFTPNANGVGQTIDGASTFYAATNDMSAVTESDALGAGAGTASLMTTLHAFTQAAQNPEKAAGATEGTWTATGSTGWNNTHDDGYYVDIPVWLRTSSTQGAALTVDAYVLPRTLTATTSGNTTTYSAPDLFKAARVAVIQTEKDGAALQTNVNTTLLPLVNALNAASLADATPDAIANPYTASTETNSPNVSVVDFYGRAQTGQIATGDGAQTYQAAKNSGAFSTIANVYGAAAIYAAATSPKITLQAGSGTTYGNASKVIIRVWLEGEDPDCWNANAGQDFNICLRFNNTTSTTTNNTNNTP
jgi:hypothetical protein